MDSITLTIDGNTITCAKGSSILTAAEDNGIKIPKLCHHHSLKPFGACRLCLVEDNKTGRLFASCVTPAAPEMILLTDSPTITKHRQNIVSLMMAEHPESCIVCNKGNRCRLRQLAANLGIGETNLYPMPNYSALEQTNPFIIRDLSKCILCGKCIRADHELVVTGAIDYNLRGFNSRPATVHHRPLETSVCTFCGTCVSICPTGALSAKIEYAGTPEQEEYSICGFCGVGCTLSMGVASNKIVEVNPPHIKKSINDATLCVRGHFAHDFLNSNQRLTSPLIRKHDELIPTSWDDALKLIADRLLDIKTTYGSQSIACLGSSKCTNEENYLFQKIARVILNTNNVDNGGYMSGRHLLSLIETRTDREDRFNFFAGPLKGLEQAEVVFILGADPGQSAPVVNYYLKRGAINNVPMIIANPRRIDLTRFSSVWLHPIPDDTGDRHNIDHFYLELINCISALLLEQEGDDSTFISRFTEGFGSYQGSLSSLNVSDTIKQTGLDISDIQEAVNLLKGKKITFLVGDDILLQKYGLETMEAVLNLSLATGSIGYKGAGIHILTKENNLVGAWDMGTVPDAIPGRLSIDNEANRKLWEQVWQSAIPPVPGLDLFQMIKNAEQGKLKALYIMGENPLRSLPQPSRIIEAFKNIEFIVVQDILLNKTAEIAHVVLPGAAFSEKEGCFTNMEGKIQTFSPVVLPPGDAKSDLEILGLIADKMGFPDFIKPPLEIRKEIGNILPAYLKADDNRQSIWIKGLDQSRDIQIAKKNDRIEFSPIISAKKDAKDQDYPFTAFLGPTHFHLGCGTRTTHSICITHYNSEGNVEISPYDGTKLNLNKGDIVRLESPFGTLERKITFNKTLGPGFIFVPLAYYGNDARSLICLTPLLDSTTSGWDSCPVRIEKVV
ncbi:MAG: molybdopterin-dependent oxidoreductase [Desulfobacterales bacterium]|nr:molybdopterin-dependent oxidoreductase [Desulfobacterales bacterium]